MLKKKKDRTEERNEEERELNAKKHFWVTIDTEMDADVHWRKIWPPQYTSVCAGIPQLLRPIWDRYDVHPVYFVSPEVLYSGECCEILKEEIRKGAIIGAHLHAEYIEPKSVWGEQMKWTLPRFPNSGYSDEIEMAKIKNLTALIEEKLGIKPVWYRGARFGVDLGTIRSLQKLGYLYDSSVTPHISWTSKGGPDHSRAPECSYYISDQDMYCAGQGNIKEVPITILGKRGSFIGRAFPEHWIFYRWLRPTHMTFIEMKHMMQKMYSRDEVVMMFHSMEIMINKTPYVRNRWMQRYYLWRLEKILEYAKKQGYEI